MMPIWTLLGPILKSFTTLDTKSSCFWKLTDPSLDEASRMKTISAFEMNPHATITEIFIKFSGILRLYRCQFDRDLDNYDSPASFSESCRLRLLKTVINERTLPEYVRITFKQNHLFICFSLCG